MYNMLHVPVTLTDLVYTDSLLDIETSYTCAADAPKGGSSGRTLKEKRKNVSFYLLLLLLLLKLNSNQ